MLVLGLCASRSAADGSTRTFLVGVDDDTLRWLTRPNGLVAAERSLGLRAVRVTIAWRRGDTIPQRRQQVWLHRVALAIELGQRIVLSVDGRAADAPLSARDQLDYCTFVRHVVQRIPIQDVVIWNEANNPTFWPRGGAAAYERLLARCWDMLHAARRSVDVIDSTAPHQQPARFLLALGAAYRASGRSRPILDTFGHNAYPETSTEPPWATHTNGSIDEGDYDQLVAVLGQAFGGTAQPLPGQGATRIWYLEDGFQTQIPPEKRHLYTGTETDVKAIPAAGAAAAAGGDAPPPDQATQLSTAIELAYCQPYVGAFFNFELIDDHQRPGWQSGLLWADGTPKPSDGAVRAAIAAVEAGTVDCSAILDLRSNG